MERRRSPTTHTHTLRCLSSIVCEVADVQCLGLIMWVSVCVCVCLYKCICVSVCVCVNFSDCAFVLRAFQCVCVCVCGEGEVDALHCWWFTNKDITNMALTAWMQIKAECPQLVCVCACVCVTDGRPQQGSLPLLRSCTKWLRLEKRSTLGLKPRPLWRNPLHGPPQRQHCVCVCVVQVHQVLPRCQYSKAAHLLPPRRVAPGCGDNAVSERFAVTASRACSGEVWDIGR